MLLLSTCSNDNPEALLKRNVHAMPSDSLPHHVQLPAASWELRAPGAAAQQVKHLPQGCPAQQLLSALDVQLVAGLLPRPGCQMQLHHPHGQHRRLSLQPDLLCNWRPLGRSQAIKMLEEARRQSTPCRIAWQTAHCCIRHATAHASQSMLLHHHAAVWAAQVGIV